MGQHNTEARSGLQAKELGRGVADAMMSHLQFPAMYTNVKL